MFDGVPGELLSFLSRLVESRSKLILLDARLNVWYTLSLRFEPVRSEFSMTCFLNSFWISSMFVNEVLLRRLFKESFRINLEMVLRREEEVLVRGISSGIGFSEFPFSELEISEFKVVFAEISRKDTKMTQKCPEMA